MSEEQKPSYYARHKEECLAKARAYQAAHKQKYSEYQKAYYQQNKDKMNAKRKENAAKYRQNKKPVFYQKKEPVKSTVPIVLSPVDELPRWSMIVSEGTTLTFE